MGLSRRDVELDVDMESAPSGAYLWGTLLTYPGGTALIDGFAPGYRGFGERFDAPGDGTTASVFLEFLGFIESLRAACDREGLTFGAYCYAGPSAEEPAVRRCAAIVEARDGVSGVADRVEQLLSAPCWIDLLDEVRARVQSLNGLGLKVIARATGFAWRTEDAGGEASIRWYGRATEDVDPVVRAVYRNRILEYNEDDVAATRHLREWFDLHGAEEIPPLP
jgi:predicted RecB family nuclease